MYVPSHFAETRIDMLHAVIRRHSLATLVTAGSSGLIANHIPLFLDAPAGTLRGHMAKANPQWRDIGDGLPGLVIFHGPQHYISPSWYASKQEHGRVVPTWNFIAVHVYGRLATFGDWERLRANVTELTDHQESQMRVPWKVTDAPDEYVDGLLGAIVGVELAIERMEGKFKLSQNRPEADQAGVAEALAGSDIAAWMKGSVTPE